MARARTSTTRFVSPAARARAWLAIAIAAGCAGCASVPGPDADPAPLHERLQRLADRYGVCDAAVAVVRRRALQSVESVHACAGQSPSTGESVFQAASLSKPVFAYAVLKLAQQGKIDLDAPVLSYLPDGYTHRYYAHLAASPADRVADPQLAQVTVRMALNHTSGLPNWSGGPLAFEGRPGAQWRYSGEGYVLLQRAVEAVTGEGLDDYMQRTVFGPLGMAHSAYTRRPALEPYLVPGTNAYGDVLRSTPFRAPVAAFTLYTSAGDYGRFLAALLQDEPTLAQLAASPVAVNAALGLGWGAGWGLERSQGDVFLWHWGNNPGYRAFVMASPRSGDGFVMFANSDKGLALAEPLGRQILPGPHPVYRFHLLSDGLANLLCETLDVCL